jgi:hypothetical protein
MERHMKRVFALVTLAMALVLGGCAMTVGPVTGLMYTNAKYPFNSTGSPKEPTRVGRATVRSFFGAIATGDASIQTAAQNGGITEIHHVDYEAQNIFGIIADFTVVVYGN